MEDWSEAEHWAWREICASKTVNFNTRFDNLDPRTCNGWDETRQLSRAFLETIILRDPFRSAIPRIGVRIVGAWFRETMDLRNARVEHELWLDLCRFERDVDFTRLNIRGPLSLDGSKVIGTLHMNDIEVEKDLLMTNDAEFVAVNLGGAKIKGQLDMNGSKFAGRLDMDKLSAENSLFMERAEFAEVILRNAKVGGTLDMDNSTLNGTLIMKGLKVGRELFMSDATFDGTIHLIFANVTSNLDLSGAKLSDLDLTGTRVGGELRFLAGTRIGHRAGRGPRGEQRFRSAKHASIQWEKGARLVLRNTHVDALQDKQDAWPSDLELDGFTYDRLGGYGGVEVESDMASRPVSWYKSWIARDKTYSPQPYRQLADAFIAHGHKEKANDILFVGRERERSHAKGRKWWGMTLLKLTIGYGYGYRYFYALYWVIGFVLVGVGFLWFSGQDIAQNGLLWAFACSLDLLLPIVKLNEEHYKFVQMIGWAKYYFYFHQLVGYILGSFLLAGLAGLTQK